jgi:hypothetical protein
MSRGRGLEDRIRATRLRIEQAMNRVRARTSSRPVCGLTVAQRANVVAVANVGESSAAQSATGVQRVRIRQVNGTTTEETDITDLTSEG